MSKISGQYHLSCVVCLMIFFITAISTAFAAEKGFEKHWSFEEKPNISGINGSATSFPQEKPMQVEMAFLTDSRTLDGFSISAWIKPAQFEQYNEIFRQECDERILFSLQEQATILALGLNINGYIECDAKMDRNLLFDGDWHFVAATFDGKTMRVFLDSKEIAHLDREGSITVTPNVPGFIGSAGGTSEWFFGEMDELQMSSSVMTPENIATAYKTGLKLLEKQYAEATAELKRFYTKNNDFAGTLAETREAYIKYQNSKGSSNPGNLRSGLMRQLRLDFDAEADHFFELTGYSPVSFIMDADLLKIKNQAELLIGQMTEYKPLTSEQWNLLSADDKKQWQEIDTLQKEFEKFKFDGSQTSIQTLTQVLQKAKGMIEERPMVREAVAPYIVPQTPGPQTYTNDEAEELLRQDWLFQCDNNPTPQRVLEEIRWAKSLANRIHEQEKSDKTFLNAALEKLETFARETESLARTNENRSDASEELYLTVRRLKREIQLANPLINFSQILLVDMPYPGGNEWQHETRHRLGYMAVPGGQLLVLNGLNLNGTVRRLMPQEPLHGSFWRPDVSFDGKRVLMSFKPHNEKSFHVYEINLDGTGLRQITAGIFDDLDPVYLPDGKNFVFSTSRSYTYVRCMPPTNAFVLARCAIDGEDVYLISQNNEPDYLPSVLNDGRLIYTRWEYTDKPLWRCQSLWTANPDGTQHNTFWGNQSVWPDLLKDARSIPGSRRVMFTGSAHHDWFAGSVGIIDPDRGLNFPDGLMKVTADLTWPESGNGPVDPVESPNYHASGPFKAYYSPYPLSEKDFLVSANKNGKFLLYLMDVDGNRELIYEGVNNILHAIPIIARETPPVLVDRVDWPSFAERSAPKPGSIYSGNVYQGAPQELQGKAKYLRILNIEPKTYTLWDNRPYISTGPVVSMVQSEGVKRILGTVPIEEDGSVWFEVPAGVALHFQLLDENHRALQTMRSFTGVMPGENRGCHGCHERHSSTPETTINQYTAMQKPPQKIMPVPWAFDPKYQTEADLSIEQAVEKALRDFAPPVAEGETDPWADKRTEIARAGTSISYVKDVQPVLDRYYADCHQGEGDGRKTFDMTRRPGFLMFDEPYVTLIGAPNWGAPGRFPTGAWGGGSEQNNAQLPPGFGIADTIPVEAYSTVDPAAYITPKPMSALSYKSRLVQLASNGEHYDIKMDPVSLLKIILWIDAMCPYIDDTKIREIPDPVFQGSDWLSIRPRLQTAPTVVRPGPFSAKYNDPAYDYCEVK